MERVERTAEALAVAGRPLEHEDRHVLRASRLWNVRARESLRVRAAGIHLVDNTTF